MKTSYRKLVVFSQLAQGWLNRHPGKSKPAYALNRIMPQLNAINTRVQDALERIDVKHAAEDERKLLIMNGDKYRFNREGQLARDEERAQFYDLEDIEVEPFTVEGWPEDIMPMEIAAFRGLVISGAEADRLLEWNTEGKAQLKAVSGSV